MKNPQRVSRSRQRGVVLIFTLIILLILTIGAVALMRSMNTSLFNAGNLAFRRDLVNQGELALTKVMTQFTTGTLNSSGSTLADNAALNYYSTMLPTNNKGVPNLLLVSNPANQVAGVSGVTIAYVIDRLCQNPGPTIGSQCVQASAAPLGGTANGTKAVSPPSATVYRLSVRVSGARSTQVFLQTTFTRAD